jgi:hypothetical protein
MKHSPIYQLVASSLTLALLLLGSTQSLAVETITLFASVAVDAGSQGEDSDSFSLAAGQIAVVETVYNNKDVGASGSTSVTLSRDGKINKAFLTGNSGGLNLNGTANYPRRVVLAGPLELSAEVIVRSNSEPSEPRGCVALLTFTVYSRAEYTALKTGSGATAASGIQSNAVVIPSDSVGPVSIIMESSVDMITWNASNPGIYGADTETRFFRLRALSN